MNPETLSTVSLSQGTSVTEQVREEECCSELLSKLAGGWLLLVLLLVSPSHSDLAQPIPLRLRQCSCGRADVCTSCSLFSLLPHYHHHPPHLHLALESLWRVSLRRIGSESPWSNSLSLLCLSQLAAVAAAKPDFEKRQAASSSSSTSRTASAASSSVTVAQLPSPPHPLSLEPSCFCLIHPCRHLVGLR